MSLFKPSRFPSVSRSLLQAPNLRRNLSSPSSFSPSSSSSSASSSASSTPRTTVNASEIAHFSKLSSQWWDESGELGLLHKMNPSRLSFVREKLQESKWRDGDESLPLSERSDWLTGMRVLDVGCGGGLLSESLARLGAETLGIDATPSNVPLAQSHMQLDPFLSMPLALPSAPGRPRLEYRHQTAEDLLAVEGEAAFDVVCAMEVLEHVDDPAGFLKDLGQLVKPGGHLFMSTISRTVLSHLLTITLAEDVLRLVSPGTHTSSKFVNPEELDAFFDDLGWKGPTREARGVAYLPWKGEWVLAGKNVGWIARQANYLYAVRKPLDS